MSAKLRLATRTNLEDLEKNQRQQMSRLPLSRLQPTREKSPGPESRLPREHSHVSQILYQKDVYKDYPAWKRWLVGHVYLPLFRQFHRRLNLFPPTRMEPDGTYSWLVHQGCFLTEEEAKADAARYPHGYVVPNVPLGRSLTQSIPEKSAIYFSRECEPLVPATNGFHVDLASIQEEANLLEATVRAARRVTTQ